LKVLRTKDLEQAIGGALGTLLQKIFGKDWFKRSIDILQQKEKEATSFLERALLRTARFEALLENS
jgi:hypothetical protein